MFSLKNEPKQIKIVLALILALYMGICIASFIYHGNNTLLGSLEKMDNDDVRYLRSAWTFLETGKITYRFPERETVFIMPGLTILLSGFCAVFGRVPILPFKIFQALLGAGSIYILFLTGRRMFSAKAGLLAAYLASVYSANIYAPNAILTESVFTFLFILLFYISCEAVETKLMRHYIWGGIVLGTAVLFRPTIILFPLVVFAMWLVKRYKAGEMLKFGSTVVLIVLAILSPWIIRNFVVFGKFIPLTLSSGNPFEQGTYINYDRAAEEENEKDINFVKIISEKCAEKGLDINDFDHDEVVMDFVEKQRGLIRVREIMTKEPLKYIKWYTWGKTMQNWKQPFLWKNLFGIEYYKFEIQHILYMMFGIAGAIYIAISGKTNSWYLASILTLLYFNTVHLPYYCFPRYVYPSVFCIMIYIAFMTVDILDKTVSNKYLQ